VKVQKPPFGGSLGGFVIRDFREPPPKIHDGRELIQQIYTLEPTETGKMLLDPISITFTDNRPNGDGQTHSLETEAVTVEITSIVGDKAPSLGELRPSAEPIELPSSTSPWLWVLAVAGVAALAIAWWLMRRRRREKTLAAVILTPEEVAVRELDALEQSGLADRDVKLFYVELTGIVRRYIEQTTGIRAPEQTTEEFLREISREGAVEIWKKDATDGTNGTNKTNKGTGGFMDHLSRLRDFLEAADLVKFAAFQPRSDDVAESVRRAKRFINIRRAEQTAVLEEVSA
jgi:hypothetical protein